MTKFITNEDYTESPPKFPRHVKHTATAWPNLTLPFHHEVNVYGHRRKVFSSPVAFYSYATSWEKAKRTNPKLVAQRVPNRISFFMPPRGTRRTFLTHRSTDHWSAIIPFSFHATSWHRAKFLDTLLSRSLTDLSFFLRHLVAQGEISWHIALSVLYRFFPFFPRHLVAQGEISRHTALLVLDRSGELRPGSNLIAIIGTILKWWCFAS